MVKKDLLKFEQLDSRILLSSNPWYIDAIKASEVWSSATLSNNKPVVAVIDSGLDLNHPSLVHNLFQNPLDPVDGQDNDNNGYIDDITGWDFVDNDNSPQDGYFHGTHVAGIVNTIGDNNVSILPVKFIDSKGIGYIGGAGMSIDYVTGLKLKGINIVAINCSFGGLLDGSIALSGPIQRASDAGIVVVMAAGNNGSDIDLIPRYPASYSFANTISVAATNPDTNLATYSNYGKNSVAVAAPGTLIYSTIPNGSYGTTSGTSMAAPMVSGGIGLLKSLGEYSTSAVLEAIKKGSSALSTLSNKVTYGLLNLSASLGILRNDPISPSPSVPTSPAPPVVSPPAPVEVKLVYSIDKIVGRSIRGWANVNIKPNKPVVQIYVNNVLRYRVVANLYRKDTNKRNGFHVTINKKFLVSKSNLITIKIVDNANKLSEVVYKGYMRR